MNNTGTATDHSLDMCGVSNYVNTLDFDTNNSLANYIQFGKKTADDNIGCFACKTGYVV